MKLLLTGVTGKVGRTVLNHFLSLDQFRECRIVVLCHNRSLKPSPRVQVVNGSLADPSTVDEAMHGVTHVVHMAAVKESPELAIDVSIKGLFLMLEAARQSSTFEQFILISGDCAVGHIFHQYNGPVTEMSERKAYPGCYALTKVLEEVMLEQYQIQYGLNGCTLRAPWIMEKDDFKCALSFGPDQFGGPHWGDLMPATAVAQHAANNKIPLMLSALGKPLKRNFVHVDDLTCAIFAALDNPASYQSLFNISMNNPVDYGQVADYLNHTRALESVSVPTGFFSNWLDNSKARMQLDWQPKFDVANLIEHAWTYTRAPDDPREIWYPG